MDKTLSILNFRSLIGRLPCGFVCAVCVIGLLYSFQLFFAPPGFFSFQIVPSVMVFRPGSKLPGPFYPNTKIHKWEEGGLAYRTKFAVKKNVYWESDRFGYRNYQTQVSEYFPIVIVGDSSILGVNLTQEDMFSQVLGKKLGRNVYPFATAGRQPINEFFSSERFRTRAPELVILACAEKFMSKLPPLQAEASKEGASSNVFYQVVLDKIHKRELFQYLNARVTDYRTLAALTIRDFFEGKPQKQDREIRLRGRPYYNGTFFADGESITRDVGAEETARLSTLIQSYDRACRERGIRFLVMIIPNKETICYDLIPGARRSAFSKKLTKQLRKAGIEVVSLQNVFDRAYHDDKRALYPIDDWHWNREGVEVAAEALAEFLRKDL